MTKARIYKRLVRVVWHSATPLLVLTGATVATVFTQLASRLNSPFGVKAFTAFEIFGVAFLFAILAEALLTPLHRPSLLKTS